jgi:hypothetical protein
VDAGSVALAPVAVDAGAADSDAPSGITPGSVAAANELSIFDVVPDSPSVLSVVEKVGPKCTWSRFDPVARKRSVVLETEECPEEIAWSHDGRKALGRVAVTEENGHLMLYDLATRKVLPTRPPGRDVVFGFDSKGQAWALTFESAPDADAKVLTWQGKKFAVEEGYIGLPGLAHSWRLDAKGEWKHVDVKVSSGEACDTMGQHVFPIERDFGFDTAHHLEGSPTSGPELKEQDPVLAQLNKATAGEPESDEDPATWYQLPTAIPGVYARVGSNDGKIGAPVAWAFTEGDQVRVLPTGALMYRGNFVLAADSLYDLRTHKPLFRNAPGTFAFWPDSTSDATALSIRKRYYPDIDERPETDAGAEAKDAGVPVHGDGG